LGVCTPTNAAGGPVVLNINDPITGDWYSVRLGEGELNQGTAAVRVPSPVLLHGKVAVKRTGSPSQTEPLAARLRFRRTTDHAELVRAPIFAESEAMYAEDGPAEEHNYAVSLLPGDFELEIEPPLSGDEERPFYPLRYSVQLPFEGESHSLDFSYDDTTRYVHGRVVDHLENGLGGVQVYAYDPDSGRRVSNIGLSQCDQVDSAECGAFVLALPRSAAVFRLKVSGTETQPGLPILDLGQYSFDLDLNGDDLLDSFELDLVRYDLLAEEVRITQAVSGMDRDGFVSPLPGATVEFRCPPSEDGVVPRRQYVFVTETNALGEIIAPHGAEPTGILLRRDCGGSCPDCDGGCYELTIVPPVNSVYAKKSSRICVSQGTAPAAGAFVVGPRHLLTGMVIAPDQSPMVEAQVVATNAEGGGFDTVTDEFGVFELLVDPGTYELLAIPPANVHLSWMRQFGVSVYDDIHLPQPIMAPWGTVFRGTANAGNDGARLTGAVVEGYLLTDNDPPTLVQFGRTHTDESGQFVLVVPAGL
jgi:hypothetical protein